MAKEYTKEQLQQLYKKLPQELQEAIFSVETADHIWNICERYDLDKISTVAKRVGNVLVGVLPPNELQQTLEKELNIDSETAKKITRDINRFIFYPVRPFLEKLYEIEIVPFEQRQEQIKIKPLEEVKQPEKEKKSSDIYREIIE